jgi:hypothetical protein
MSKTPSYPAPTSNRRGIGRRFTTIKGAYEMTIKHTQTPWHISLDSRGIAMVEGTAEESDGTALFIASDWGHRNKKGNRR